ncbi:SRPBCC domain-containing protein [Mycobacteroides immunogenum]|uniref:SRPBCC family protein n=1 Tax=Mycobacteroides immunogenum TaxID=83262 RepID=UPI0025B73917|nr:SRPBCC domain-containing protein [Mycobacteroides immunogenum]WJR36028.1 SRPBCC domain-containing protein [Mycobacteroides immunogenum]
MTEQVGDLTTVKFDHHYPYPAHRVWSILVSPHLFGQWIKDFETTRYETGLTFSFSVFPFMGSGFVGEIDGSFTKVVDDELLAYRMTTRDGSISIDSCWTLNPDPGGTRLMVDATGFQPADTDQMRFRQLCLVGWPAVLDRIDELLRER